MGDVLLILGLIAGVVGGIWTLVYAFRESVMWGLGCLFLWPVQLLFYAFHWQEAKKPALVSIAGIVLVAAGLMQTASARKHAQEEAVARATPKTTTHASFESVMASMHQEVPAQPAAAAAPRPAPDQPEPEKAAQVITKVYADSSTRLFYAQDCATHPDNAILMSKSLAIGQGYKAAACK